MVAYQRQSDVPKRGEPLDHQLAVLFTKNFLEGLGQTRDYGRGSNLYVCNTDEKFYYPDHFCKDKGIEYNFHVPDLTVSRFNDYWMRYVFQAVVEFDGKTDYEVTLDDGTVIKGKRTRHDTPEQKIRDGIFEDYMAQFHKKVKVIRIEKADAFQKWYLHKVFSQAGLIK